MGDGYPWCEMQHSLPFRVWKKGEGSKSHPTNSKMFGWSHSRMLDRSKCNFCESWMDNGRCWSIMNTDPAKVGINIKWVKYGNL